MLEAQLERLRRRCCGSRSCPASIRTWRSCATSWREYFAGTLTDFTVPLVFRGTPFQERVWRELLRIPYGETRSYAGAGAGASAHPAVSAPWAAPTA